MNLCPNNRFAQLLTLSLILGLAVPAVATIASPKTTFQVEEATISGIHRAILAKELTSTELVHLYLARVKAYNGTAVEMPAGLLGPIKTIPNATGVNAFITLNLRPAARKAWGFDGRKARSMTDPVDGDPAMPDALEVAATLDAHFAKTGRLIGPLHGVVIAIKDQYDTFDLRTTSGADAFYANDRPPDDATFVARLRAAGAIILGKVNMGEYAAGVRSSFGGVTVTPYDTERSPGSSSGGSAVAVAMNFVTCAIAEETNPSIRFPSRANSAVGISPTQELVSRDGMVNIGINTRTGPIARTVEDAARILTVIAGYDPKDELTAFAADRLPNQPYENFTRARSLAGLRIGVVREYMDKSLFTVADEQSIDLVEQAIADLKKLGATIVDPGADGLFTDFIRRYSPRVHNAAWTVNFPDLFPVDTEGRATADHVTPLVDLAMDPSRVPGPVTLRDFPRLESEGERKYGFNLYLRQRGDANIRTFDDLINQANFYSDTGGPSSKKASLENYNRPLVYNSALRMQRRFALQQIVLACFAELQLDAVVYPTGNIPSAKIGAPNEPTVNGRGTNWTLLGGQGFPVICVPAGFTTLVYDRVRDPDGVAPNATKLAGPVPARLPVGVDFLGRPFSEPTLLTIASAYERATRHREPPPRFGPVAPLIPSAMP